MSGVNRDVRKALGYAYAALEEMAAENDSDIEIGGEPISPYTVMSIVKDAYDNLSEPPEPGESCRICDEWLDKATCPHCGSEYLICVNCDRVQNK